MLAIAWQADALHRKTPRFVQITDQPGQSIEALSYDPRANVLLFSSDGDLLGNGNSTPQIFLFDHALRVRRDELGIFQLTFGTAPSTAPTGARRVRTLAFESEADLLSAGTTGRQVFLGLNVKWKKGFVPLRQVTRGAGESFGPQLSSRGKFLLFFSTDDLLDQGLAPGAHLYLSVVRSLERSTCPGYPCPSEGNPGLLLVSEEAVTDPAIGRRGRIVAFASDQDLAGTGCGTGVSQIFVRELVESAPTQLTCGSADSLRPVLTASGLVLFESAADLAGTGSTHSQIFIASLDTDPVQLTQLTFGTDGDSTQAISTGTRRRNRFFFRSTADLTGAGGAGAERLYVFDDEDGLTRLTDGESLLAGPAGRLVFTAFVTDSDIAGTGNDEPQLFLVNTSPLLGPIFAEPTPLPTPVLESITLAPVAAVRAIGQVQRYTATGHFSGGTTQNLTQQLTYGTGDSAIAQASNEAGDRSRIDAVGAGVTTVTAVDPGSGVAAVPASLEVVGPLERLTLAPVSVTRAVGQDETYTATGHYPGGVTLNLTQEVVYATSDSAVATATNEEGNRSRVVATGLGTATVSATEPISGISTTASGDDATMMVQ